MKEGDKVIIMTHNIKGYIQRFYDDDRVLVATGGDDDQLDREYLILKKDLRVIKDKTYSTWR